MQSIASEILLAREQARLGLIDDAVAAWDRAIAQLTPLAVTDPELGDRLRTIEAERNLALAEDALHDDEAGDAGDESGTDVAALGGGGSERNKDEILEAPEPTFDPSLLNQVGDAVHSVQPDYPVPVDHHEVLAWVESLSSGSLRDWFARSLTRSGAYMDRFQQIFAEEGIPRDLVHLAHVESAFIPYAYSRAAAKGIFQFIAGTGRRYGLQIDTWRDERADPEKSARAAASYLRDLYAEFGDWKLAMAAYNSGEGRVRGAIAQSGSKDFWELSRRKLLPRETRNYVPAILAATIVAKQAESFGFGSVEREAPLVYERVSVPEPTDFGTLARLLGTDAATIRKLNPELRRGITPPGMSNYALKAPSGSGSRFSEAWAALPPSERIARVEHRVRRGETVKSVARRFGVSSAALRDANGLSSRSKLAAGQVLLIPRWAPGAMRDDGAEGVARDGGSGHSRPKYHKVARGESLGTIARRYGVSVRQLQSWNGMRGTKLVAGKSLRVGSQRVARASSRSASESETSAASKRRSEPSRQANRAVTGFHTVRAGDTLWSIGQRHGVSLEALRAANRLGSKDVVKRGQRLAIPSGAASAEDQPSQQPRSRSIAVVHVVQRGETLFRIAQRYGVTVETLCSLNDISSKSVLTPGTQLTIR